MPSVYYKKYEQLRPYKPQEFSEKRTILFQVTSIFFIGCGFSYLFWRWTESLNLDFLWFSTALVLAETLGFIGSLLMIVICWEPKSDDLQPPVNFLSEMDSDINETEDRPIKIDIFLMTYNEPAVVVEDGLIDVRKVEYPFDDVEINLFVCDDGNRDGSNPAEDNFKELAVKYDATYIGRKENVGGKPGNLNNVFWRTEGDLLVILDADTRLFPEYLSELTGYFRDEKMAWVQSPQWFYDINQGVNINKYLFRRFKVLKRLFPNGIPVIGEYNLGRNPLGTDARIFYDYIMRYRNSVNGAFCCGAGSIHRRKTLEYLITNYSNELQDLNSVLKLDHEEIKPKHLMSVLEKEDMVVGPFVHCTSEDMFTSAILHSDNKNWKSHIHSKVLCRMLSPQTLTAYINQYSNYANGTFEFGFSKFSPLIKEGFNFRQRLAYFDTLFSYLSVLWTTIFLLSPIIFYFTLLAPIKALNVEFFTRFIFYSFAHMLLISIAYWGTSTTRSEQYNVAGFGYKLKALFNAVMGIKWNFITTPKLAPENNFLKNLRFVWLHILIVMLTICGFAYNIALIIDNDHPSVSAFSANTLFAFYNIYQLNPIIRASFVRNYE